MSQNISLWLKLWLITFSTLTLVPVSVSQLEEQTNDVYETWGTTNFLVTTFRYVWTINNFSFCCQATGDQVISPMFSSPSKHACQLRLHLYPKADRNIINKGFVSLYINSISCNMSADYKLGIINDENKEINVRNDSVQFVPDTSFGEGKFVMESFLTDENNHLLKDNTLTIFCEITEVTESSSVSRTFEPPPQDLENDLEVLLENHAFSDITLCADGKEFKVHRGILATRSTVFREIFEKNNSDNCTDLVQITNTKPKILQEILRYIYTDKTSNLDNNAQSLLAAAEEYRLPDLKIICENSLIGTLSAENAVDLLILGDKYLAENLKMEAKDFIINNLVDVKKSPGFVSLLSSPQLALETFRSIG